jgi:hypothetical protein
MAKKEKRFETLHYESSLAVSNRIIKDTKTGVLYLFCSEGYAGGLTPLLGSDGKPILYDRELTDKSE